MRPRLYLDVDGVLSPFVIPDSGTDTWTDWDRDAFAPTSRAMADALAALPVDIHWLTTWRDEANTHLAPRFGWPARPVLDRDREIHWWKLDALLDDHPEGVPFVWCDDELDERRALLDPHFTRRLAALAAPYLLVCPARNVGLTPADLERIHAFVTNPTG